MNQRFQSSAFKQAALPALLWLCVAGLVWQYRVNRSLHAELESLQAAQERQHSEQRRTAHATAAREQRAKADLERLRAQLAALPSNPAGTAKDSWLERVQTLKQLFAQSPDLSIPEMQFATEEDWLEATRKPLVTQDDYRRAMARLRDASINHFISQLNTALKQFTKDTRRAFPDKLTQLQTYLATPVDEAIWTRYRLAPVNELGVRISGGSGMAITQVGPVDEDYDSQFVIAPNGYGSSSYSQERLRSVIEALAPSYQLAHPDRPPQSAADLLPFATTTEQRAVLEKQLQQEQKSQTAPAG